jgi:hypothetical protein
VGLLLAEGDHGVRASGAPGGKRNRYQGRQQYSQADEGERDWVAWLHPIEQTGQGAAERCGRRKTDHKAGGYWEAAMPRDKMHDICRPRSKSQAHADFLRSLGDELAKNAVESDGGQQQREDSEHTKQHGAELRVSEKHGDSVAERFQFADGDFGIQRRHFSANGSIEWDGIGICPNHKRDRATGILCQGPEERGWLGPVHFLVDDDPPFGRDHSDNRGPCGRSALVLNSKALPDGVGIPKVLAYECRVNDGDRLCIWTIVVCEQTAAQQLDA